MNITIILKVPTEDYPIVQLTQYKPDNEITRSLSPEGVISRAL